MGERSQEQTAGVGQFAFNDPPKKFKQISASVVDTCEARAPRGVVAMTGILAMNPTLQRFLFGETPLLSCAIAGVAAAQPMPPQPPAGAIAAPPPPPPAGPANYEVRQWTETPGTVQCFTLTPRGDVDVPPLKNLVRPRTLTNWVRWAWALPMMRAYRDAIETARADHRACRALA